MNIQKGKGMGITITFSDSSGNNRHPHMGSLILCKSVLGCKGPGPVPRRKAFIRGKILRPGFPGSYMIQIMTVAFSKVIFFRILLGKEKEKFYFWEVEEIKCFFSVELLRGLNMGTCIENLPEEYRVCNFSQTYLTVESVFRAEH